MLTLESPAKRPKTSHTASSSSSRERFDISLSQVTQLPEDIQRHILPPERLTHDILELQRPEARSEEAGKQLTRFRFLEKHLPFIKDEWKNNTLLQTLRRNHPSFFHLLFKNTGKPDIPALLRAAVQARNNEVFDGLLQRTPVPMPPESLNETLDCLALYGQPEKLEQLLQRQPEAHRPSVDRIEEFRNRARTQQQKIQEVSERPPVEAHLALFRELAARALFESPHQPHKIIALLQHPGLDINAGNAQHQSGDTLLQTAIRLGDSFVFNALLADPRLDVNAVNARGKTALHVAVATPARADMMNALLALPEIQANCRDSYDRTPLYVAVNTQNKKAVEALLKRPEIDCASYDPNATLLHRAAYEGDPDILQMLLKNRAFSDVNVRNIAGETPLYWAVLANAESAMQTLLAIPGIDVGASDAHGETPLSLAARCPDATIANLLRQHGATE